jgi:hypothetical protein
MRRLIAGGVPLLIIVLLVVAQLVLPGVAAQHVRDRLARSGQVLSVSVSAFPAIELLWHQADSVTVRLGTYRSSSSNLGSNVGQAVDVGTLRASARVLDSGLLTLRHASLTKTGSTLQGSALVSEADLRHSLPVLQSVTPVASGGGELILRGKVNFLGATATVDGVVAARNGAVVVAPNVPFGALATVRVFSNPHVYVQSIAASPAPDGFRVSATGRLR